MNEKLIKINDYTIAQQLDAPHENISGYGDGIYIRARITRTFNFLAAQMTTVTRDLAYEGRGGSAGGSSAISTQTIIQNFSDIQSDAEITLMHGKLAELGGKPPALDTLTRGLGKKPSGLAAKA
ncbi:MAG: hypothetical protein RBS08_01840 [Bdellovibrionales bacterium]|jgi:hypothetical protein|nr:hypothetical protein [Bdellovibrionales bacterium]